MSQGALAAKGWTCPQCHERFPERGAPGRCPSDGAALVRAGDAPDPNADAMIGRDLDGRFTITARLGAGSMGTVYRAKQHPVGREVAIKILRSERALDDAAKARFLREARANSLLQSPHTVTVFDFGQSQTGELYLAMELLEGESLGQRIARMGRVPAGQAIDVARQALRSLGEAHAKGVVHRDLKPDNLFFARMKNSQGKPEEIVKVLDFGIAKMLGEGAGPLNAIETQAGTVFGTPRYMSPEQAQAKPLDARSDLYSLGVILYHMLAGRPPFTDDDAIIVMARHIKSTPKPFADVCPDARVPPEIEACVMRALAKDPAKRPANADEMAQQLVSALESARAHTSGVRASLSSVAGVPSTIPPPPAAAPPPPIDDSLELTRAGVGATSRVWLAVAGGLLLLGAAAIVLLVWAHESAPSSAAPLATQPSATATATATATVATAATTTAAASSPKAVDVRALPKAAPRPTARARPAAPPTVEPGPSVAPTATAAPPPPAATASGRYGVFE